MIPYTIILLNSSGNELDRKSGDDWGAILSEYASEGCLSGGDCLLFIDEDD